MLYGFQCCKLLAELHFIVLLVDTVVALAADVDALVELVFIVVFAEVGAAMEFTRYEVVEG